MVAAGVAFFVLLATFPAIAAIVSLYSLFADPEKGRTLLAALPAVLPEQAVEIIARQTRRVAEQQGGSGRTLIFAPVLGVRHSGLEHDQGNLCKSPRSDR